MKDIPLYEGRYAITENGQVWSYPKEWWGHRHEGKWLKQVKISGGYWAVSLVGSDKKSKTIGVHRLVARTYVPQVKGKPHVNHIDHTKTNNHYTNLEWVTRSENTKHAASVGKMSRIGNINGRWKYSDNRINLVRELSSNGLTKSKISFILDMPWTTIKAIVTNVMRSAR